MAKGTGNEENVLNEDHELESRLLKTVLKLDEIDKNIYRLTDFFFGFSRQPAKYRSYLLWAWSQLHSLG